ncbi:hypothetical protein PNF30_16195 [Bacillus safensis]|uniref:hypothetical protein n=1 Tax=Bacillus TaxID=1386 RepID=UPI002342E9B7|nr:MULTISPECIES: hypothetical protein [Bacillus]MEC3814151.1 hypothetical protein [Bacillus altitudinis]WCL57020.1 hypothetical protein PNF30_16195 [Bacillus safensis]
MYYYEIEQKEKLNSRVTIPIGVLTLLVGLVIYYFKNIKDIDLNGWGIVFFVVYILFILSIVFCGYLVFKAYYNYTYHYLPDPTTFQNDTNKIIDYYETNYETFFKNEGAKSELISDEINKMLCNYYKECTTQNVNMNKLKVTYLRYAGYATVIALFLALFTVLPFQFSIKDDKVNKVEIQQLDEVITELNKLNKGEQMKMNNNNTSSQTPPPKPQPSGPRVITENFDLNDLIKREDSK